MQTLFMIDNETLYTKLDLCKQLKLSLATINKLLRNKEIPYIKIGRSVRFTASQVDQIIKSRIYDNTAA